MFIQFVTMETAREEKLCGDLMELKIVSVDCISGPRMKKYILSSLVMRLERKGGVRELIVDFLLTYI